MMNIHDLLHYTVDQSASDLHLSTGRPPTIRVDGDLQLVKDTKPLDEHTLRKMLLEVIPKTFSDQLDNKLDIDLSITISNSSRFRVNIFHQYRGLSAALRVIPFTIPSLEELDFSPVFHRLCQLKNGLIIVTGPTGSGKTTTIAAMIDYINQNKQSHILTIEDPIEYIHECKQCLVQQREIHHHTKDFNIALRQALREDPDYILVGEMRDLETIRLALTAAETGHLVFTTLHTNSSSKTIDRIIDVFPEGEKAMVRAMLSESLQAVISQVLVKKIGGKRTAAQEIMLCSTAIRNLIRENKIPQIYSTIQTGQMDGMQTMEQSLRKLLDKTIIDEAQYNLFTAKVVK